MVAWLLAHLGSMAALELASGGGAQVCLIVEGRAGARTPSSFDTGQRQSHAQRCGACDCQGGVRSRGLAGSGASAPYVVQATVSNSNHNSGGAGEGHWQLKRDVAGAAVQQVVSLLPTACA